EIQIHDPRHARYVALMERIGLLPIPKVLGFLRGSPRLVRDFTARDHRPAREHIESSGVILKVRGRGAGRLPDAFEIWLAIGSARQSLWKGNKGARQGDDRDRGETLRKHQNHQTIRTT